MKIILAVFLMVSFVNAYAARVTYGVPVKIVTSIDERQIFITMPSTAEAIANGAGDVAYYIYARNESTYPDMTDLKMNLIMLAYINKLPITLEGTAIGASFYTLERVSTDQGLTVVPVP